MERLLMPLRLYEGMVGHAMCASPAEAVGLLGGHPNGNVVETVPLPNVSGLRTFLADPYAQFRAEKWLKEGGLLVVGVYHSHPGGGVALSETDRRLAVRGLAQVVIALGDPPNPSIEVRAYRIVHTAVAEIPLLVEG